MGSFASGIAFLSIMGSLECDWILSPLLLHSMSQGCPHMGPQITFSVLMVEAYIWVRWTHESADWVKNTGFSRVDGPFRIWLKASMELQVEWEGIVSFCLSLNWEACFSYLCLMLDSSMYHQLSRSRLSLHDGVSQFLTIYVYTYTHLSNWFCFSGKHWLMLCTKCINKLWNQARAKENSGSSPHQMV